MRRETEREREREGDREAATEAKTETVTEPKPCVYACVLVVSSLTCEPTYSFATVRFWPQLCSNHLIQLAHVFGLEEREKPLVSFRAVDVRWGGKFVKSPSLCLCLPLAPCLLSPSMYLLPRSLSLSLSLSASFSLSLSLSLFAPLPQGS